MPAKKKRTSKKKKPTIPVADVKDKKGKHHEIAMWRLVLPGAFFFISIIFILMGLREIAFLVVGLAIIAVLLMHWDKE